MAHASRSGDSLKEPVVSFHHVVLRIELRLSAWQQAPLPTEAFVISSTMGQFFIATFPPEEGDLSPAVGALSVSPCCTD